MLANRPLHAIHQIVKRRPCVADKNLDLLPAIGQRRLLDLKREEPWIVEKRYVRHHAASRWSELAAVAAGR